MRLPATDAGSHTFNVTLGATGTQTIDVQDAALGGLRGSACIVIANAGGGGKRP